MSASHHEGAPPGLHVDPRLAKLKEENSRILHEDIRNRKLTYRALPEVITLNHTDICNLKCIMCPRSKGQGRHRLPRPALEYIAAELFPAARKVVLTTAGGEPLAVDFDFLVEEAIEYGVKVDVVTNGVLLTPELYARARLALDHLNVSMDAHVPEVYEAIRRGASFDRIHENLCAIRDARRASPDPVLFSLSAVVIRSNIEHLDGFVRYAAGMGADAVVFQRAREYLNPAPEELPQNSLSRDRILEHIHAAREAARDAGINLFLSEFQLPSVEVKPLRAKIPEPIEDQGLCWFMAQNFNVLYTGDVYPCCVSTDHCLGNVLYEHPVDIWNGAAAQRLRAAQLGGRGTLFCSGCMNAPHLKARLPGWLARPLQKVRMARRHFQNKRRNRLARERGESLYRPEPPRMHVVEGAYTLNGLPFTTRRFPHANELLALNPGDRSLWYLDRGALFRKAGMEDEPRELLRFREGPAPLGTCLFMLSAHEALVGFEEDGRLYRVALNGRGAEHEEVLSLSHDRSYVREAITRDPDGGIWVGEYGTFSGARCAHLYRSDDEGRSFRRVRHFEQARHIHTVFAPSRGNEILVTTGDLPSERRLYMGSANGRPFREILSTWSGFTGAAETNGFFHFGTDLRNGNGFVRLPRSLEAEPEFRPMPGGLDLQVRQIIALDDGRLLAMGSLDDNFLEDRRERNAALFLSRDEGATWTAIQPFAEDWSDVPEKVQVLSTDPLRLLTVFSLRPLLLELT